MMIAPIVISCSNEKKMSMDRSLLKDITESVPNKTKWVKVLKTKEFTITINATTTSTESQVSIFLEKDGKLETVTTFVSPPSVRIGQADLNNNNYDEIIFIGASLENLGKEIMLIFGIDYNKEDKLWFLKTIGIPALQDELLEGTTGNQTYAIKPPYIESIMEMTRDYYGGKKILRFKLNENMECKLYSINGRLVQEPDN